ncbi:hypothetical protein HY637_00445 [Candidatus Woesearchaeota archaeon]|nr:hypothetical protein [Candidatus Woesearchaeota archaeon]
MNGYLNQPMKWYKDNKLVIGVVIVVVSFILGFWGKVLIVKELYRPVELVTGISVYAFSWILLFVGAAMVGWSTVKRINYRIHHHVKKTVKKTYHHAKNFPRKATQYTKELHKKSMDRLQATSRKITRSR